MNKTNLIELIEQYRSHAPVDVVGLIKALGIKVDTDATLEPGISGLLEKNGGQYEIKVKHDDHEFRKRFTLAHELGHYLLHRSLIGNGIVDNAVYRTMKSSKYSNPNINEKHETEANKFAAALLMPLERVTQDYEAFNDINKVAGKWQVSPAALRIRLSLPKE